MNITQLLTSEARAEASWFLVKVPAAHVCSPRSVLVLHVSMGTQQRHGDRGGGLGSRAAGCSSQIKCDRDFGWRLLRSDESFSTEFSQLDEASSSTVGHPSKKSNFDEEDVAYLSLRLLGDAV